jgi:hypothetical protein
LSEINPRPAGSGRRFDFVRLLNLGTV